MSACYSWFNHELLANDVSLSYKALKKLVCGPQGQQFQQKGGLLVNKVKSELLKIPDKRQQQSS